MCAMLRGSSRDRHHVGSPFTWWIDVFGWLHSVSRRRRCRRHHRHHHHRCHREEQLHCHPTLEPDRPQHPRHIVDLEGSGSTKQFPPSVGHRRTHGKLSLTLRIRTGRARNIDRDPRGSDKTAFPLKYFAAYLIVFRSRKLRTTLRASR